MSTRLGRTVAAAVLVAAGWLVPTVLVASAPFQTPRRNVTLPSSTPRPRAPESEEIIVKADSVIGIRLETPVAFDDGGPDVKLLERRSLGEGGRPPVAVVARVTRDVRVNNRTAIPAGARLEGTVTKLEAAEPSYSRIGLTFTTVVLHEGKTRLPIQTETIYRSANQHSNDTAKHIGAGAVLGALVGAAIAGKKGAIVGGTAGAASGAAASVATATPSDVMLPAGTSLNVRLAAPLTVIIERRP